MKIAFIGTGHMGLPMARRLCDAGHSLRVWNRNPDKAMALADHGATIVTAPHQAVHDVDAVITMLSDGAVVSTVLFDMGVAAAMRPGASFIDMSSISPRQARDHAARLAEHRVDVLDAPVSGGTLGAAAGTLAIMAGGPQQVFESALNIFQSLGRATRVGEHGAGQLAKLANQMIVGISIGAVAEALLLAARGGADVAKVREAIRGGFAESRILDVHGERMVARDFAARAAMSVQLKDMNNAIDTAHSLGFIPPVTRLFADLYAEGVAGGMADLDHSALFMVLEQFAADGQHEA